MGPLCKDSLDQAAGGGYKKNRRSREAILRG
jgi:hypothetical protein